MTNEYDIGLTEILLKHVFVGVVDLDRELSVVQYQKKLYLVNHGTLAYVHRLERCEEIRLTFFRQRGVVLSARAQTVRQLSEAQARSACPVAPANSFSS